MFVHYCYLTRHGKHVSNNYAVKRFQVTGSIIMTYPQQYKFR